MYVVSAEQMRALDDYTIQEIGVPAEVLMENAGASLVREIRARLPAGRAVVVCGTGNNGGDGFVAGRWLANSGWQVSLFLLGSVERLSDASRIHFRSLAKSGVQVHLADESGRDRLRQSLAHCDLVVDAILGLGLSRPVRDGLAEVIQWINQSPAFVCAADIASGVNADTGQVMGIAVQADLTVTFAFPKRGHYLFPGASYTGELVVADISIPAPGELAGSLDGHLLQPRTVREWVPRRRRHSHKGSYGHVLVLGGSRGMRGAPVFAASAALASGSGLVTVALPEGILDTAATLEPAALFWPLPEVSGRLDTQVRLSAEMAERGFQAVAFGPGLGLLSEPGAWLEDLLSLPVPLVIDADGLNLLARHLELLDLRRGQPTVLTPHPGEMSRLVGLTVPEVESRRWEVAQEFATRYGVTLVLKGSHTLCAFPDGQVYLNPTGSAALAKAGSGDVLTGMILSFLGQGGPVRESVCAAVYVHGLAGQIAGRPSEHSLHPLGLVEAIPQALHSLQG